MSSKTTLYMVVYDDGDAVCQPMNASMDCEGALESVGGPVALFASRRAARTAIEISKAHAKLLRLQGKPADEDFLPPCSKHVRIIKAEEL